MQIHTFLRSKRMKRGFMSYSEVARAAAALGFNISTQALSKAERLPAYMLPSTREMYTSVYSLTKEEVDMLDVLSAQAQIRKGSNTNPYMVVVDERIFMKKVDRAVEESLRFVESTTSPIDDAQRAVLTTAMRGLLCQALTPKSS